MFCKYYLKAFTLIIITLFLFNNCSSDKENSVPVVSLSYPKEDETIYQGTLVNIKIDANDRDGAITLIKLFLDDVELAVFDKNISSFQWDTKDVKKGLHTIRVAAKDNKDEYASFEVNIYISLNENVNIPVACIDVSKISIDKSEEIFFYDKSSNQPTEWLWEFGDGNTSNVQNPTHKYEKKGVYTIDVKVSNNYGADTVNKSSYIKVFDKYSNPVSDFDGNVYGTVRIGSQIWLAENLRSRHYSDGREIELINNSSEWNLLQNNDKACCYYSGANKNEYGLLYNWSAATDNGRYRGACPDGWHIPSTKEWNTLIDFLGGELTAGIKLKETGIEHWYETIATDDYGFSALPGGFREGHGGFSGLKASSYFWTSTSYSEFRSWNVALHANSKSVNINNFGKNSAFSVRCIKN